jgi:hypothetical protein
MQAATTPYLPLLRFHAVFGYLAVEGDPYLGQGLAPDYRPWLPPAGRGPVASSRVANARGEGAQQHSEDFSTVGLHFLSQPFVKAWSPNLAMA